MERDSEGAAQTGPVRTWVSRADAVAALVLAVIFVTWVAGICVRQLMAGKDVQVLQSDEAAAEYLIDLNRADATELMLLPGIGEVRSKRIVDWRAEHGSFHSLDDVRKATGLSENGVERLRKFVTLGEAE